jgi:ABC-type transport system substrate-binding protein
MMLAAVLVVATPFSTARAAQAKEMVLYGVGGDFKGFDPVDCGDVESAAMDSRVYEGLLEYAYLDRPYHVEPRLAEGLPEISADGLTYTFHIKKGVHFSDDPCFPDGKGREVTADDFVYSFSRILDPKLESSGDWIFLEQVAGAKEWAAKGDVTAKIPGFTALDRYTFEIKLRRPDPQLLWVLTMPYAFVLPHEAVEHYCDNFRGHPVGTGPYILKSWWRNYRIEFDRNPAFSGQTYPATGEPADRAAGLLEDAGKPLPLVDRIVDYDIGEFYTIWQMFLGGQLASTGVSKDYFAKVITPQLDLSNELRRRGIRLYKTPEMSLGYMGFNMSDPVVGASPDPSVDEKHRKLRQAFALSINVKTYCEVIRNNRDTPANSILPPGVAGHSDQPNPYTFDLPRAKKLIAEAGYPDGKDTQGHPLRLTMIEAGAGSTDARQGAEFLSEQLKQIGVDLYVQQMSFSEYLRREHEGDAQILSAGWVIDYPDGQNFLQLLYGPNKTPGINFSNYKNPEFDKLYDQVSIMQDSPERTALYEKMCDIAMADCPWVLMTYPLSYGLFQPWFQDYKPHAFPYPNSKFYKVLPH